MPRSREATCRSRRSSSDSNGRDDAFGSLGGDAAPVASEVVEVNAEDDSRRIELRRGGRRPLDERDGLRGEVVREQAGVLAGECLEAEEIDVGDRKPASIE